MGEDDRRGTIFDGFREYLSRMDETLIERAHKHDRTVDEPIGTVEGEHSKAFLFSASEIPKLFERTFRTADHRTLGWDKITSSKFEKRDDLA